jgi:DNA ligase-associated metallophosphoesterase
MKTLDMIVAGEPVVVDTRRALVWPGRRWLMVADLHLGKASLMRQAGAALPRGTTTRDLARLGILIDEHAPKRLIVLGDLIHGAERLDAEWLATFAAWRVQYAALPLTLVAGNHDRHMPLARFGFDVVREIEANPFVLRHAPDPHSGLHVVAGHVHPAVMLRDGRIRHRLPAFWLGPRRTLLPAFGSLCGLTPRDAESDDRLVAVTPGGVVSLGLLR